MLIKNARIVTRDEVFTGTLRVENGAIRELSRGTTAAPEAVDWEGDFLLPGLVELHTDNLEKHLAPRPGVHWNTDAAFVIHDAQIAAAGITTVFDALAIGTRAAVGVRGREVQLASAAALTRFSERKLLRAEHFLHLRCEVATEDVIELFDTLGEHPLLRLASVMDHTPGQRQWHDRTQWRRFQERHGKWTDEQAATMLTEMTTEQERYADAHRHAIVEQAAREGIVLAEFPTTRAAAAEAKKRGIATIMGAPNVVRGGSHSGNVSALELAQAGLLDILSSDYAPSSLLTAAFDLVTRADWTLPRALATVSWEPAHKAGLADRGAIAPGLRADFVRVAMLDTLPVPRATYRAGTRVV
ncbi:alpha-D-ribose 1-methylphosphonate 5-triphosphate diphosphatase [Paraburkholderia sp. A3BS-1L]|uniref:alpha-D-ribose 1-methylphosphonate 5-triphosphate diphosphatase n=1 Tax=Paraburkholderia sp. A3BS-1L TaxID=3028375 RepID=UPI003DAA2813